MHTRTAAAVVICVPVVALALTACGSTSKSASATDVQASIAKAVSQSGGPASQSSTATAASSPGELVGSPNVCALLPVATVASITGKPFTMGESHSTPSEKVFSCNYTSAVSVGDQLDVSIVGMDGEAGFQADLDTSEKHTMVSGIGDRAITSGGLLGGLEVLYGDVEISVSGDTVTTLDQGKQLVSTLHAKL